MELASRHRITHIIRHRIHMSRGVHEPELPLGDELALPPRRDERLVILAVCVQPELTVADFSHERVCAI